jgi:acyl dehydratase
MPLVEGQSSLGFEDITVGQVFRTSETFNDSDMESFARLSGDYSGIHTDPEIARQCGFTDKLQYGFLLSSLVSRIVGENCDRAVCASVSLDFIEPVMANMRIDVTAEVIRIQEALRSIVLQIQMTSGGTLVIRGKVVVVFISTI